MSIGRTSSTKQTRVVVLTADAELDDSVRKTFGASAAIELVVVSGHLAEQGDALSVGDATVVVVDLDAGRADEMAALARLMSRVGTWTCHRGNANLRSGRRAHTVADAGCRLPG